MRPELDKRFCGRCGEPCGGFEEFSSSHIPPRRCAECAIDKRLWIRWTAWLFVFLSTAFVVYVCSLVVGTQFLGRPSAARFSSSLNGFLALLVVLFLIGIIALLRVIRREGERARRIREEDAHPTAGNENERNAELRRLLAAERSSGHGDGQRHGD